MALKLYHKKRNFNKTSEPKGREHTSNKRTFVVQEHHASRLHFDFRLEMSGVMKSWAVPKGPSMNPDDKHLAVMVEDHPIEYSSFQGAIPEGQYGAGEVRRWDYGTYEPIGDHGIEEQLAEGKLTFILKGKKLKGEFHMVRMNGRGENNWLFFKHKDEYADPDWELKPILGYGSRKESKKIKESLEVGAKALEQLVARSKTRKRTVLAKPSSRKATIKPARKRVTQIKSSTKSKRKS